MTNKNNKLIIAAAGSGKTTYIVDKALEKKDGRVLITTFTLANEAEIRKKIIKKNRCIPQNITVQPWFSFLLQHGARPYQDYFFENDIDGLLLVSGQSGLKYKTKQGKPVYFKENGEFEQHYFSPKQRIYSDKLAKFVFRCNEKSGGAVIDRLSRIFRYLFIDEVQDLSGYDLNLLKLIFASNIDTLLVGDPRQSTYSTNDAAKNKRFRKSKIVYFFEDDSIEIEKDDAVLVTNYRCIEPICDLSNNLYPDLSQTKSGNNQTSSHMGVFLVKQKNVDQYLEEYKPVQLRFNKKTNVNPKHPVMTFGDSKGLSFERVLIYPTVAFVNRLKNSNAELVPTTRSKYYVAITRAKQSVGIVYDYNDLTNIPGVQKYI